MKHKLERSAFLPWLGLALIFCFLAIDETAVIHERFTQPVRETLGTDGLLHYAWVIPYGLAVLVIAILYLRFLFRLPKRFLILFIVAGAIYVCGAIGFEMLSGNHEVPYGRENLLYCTYYTLEELFEMTGIVLFIYGLLSYITEKFDGLSLNLKADKAET
ncbi:MAG: hypothetical protein O7C75_08110 [Verrucomicrobia bacterium]|nr:hypothetical protein [Verrucomicrobiota bacterium]